MIDSTVLMNSVDVQIYVHVHAHHCNVCGLLTAVKKAHTELVGLSTETQSKLDELLPECAVDACRRQ